MTPGDVRRGMAVVDADGRALGKVTRLDAWAFEVRRGFPNTRSWVVGYAEVVGIEDGRVRVARSPDTLFELAAGELPHAWRHTLPPTPSPGARRELAGVRPGAGAATPISEEAVGRPAPAGVQDRGAEP